MMNLKDILQTRMSSQSLSQFFDLVTRYRQTDSSYISSWNTIQSPGPSLLPQYMNLRAPSEKVGHHSLDKLVVCKLNGGLGTSMGCEGPKSRVIVRNGRSFLDLIVDQIRILNQNYRVNVPLVLMNSFYTDEETQKGIEKYKNQILLQTFLQNRFPRLRRDSELPLEETEYGVEAWYPPGHGDFFSCIGDQGLLDGWIAAGKEIIFVSNADNLGATVDGKILHYMLETRCPFLMEVTEKTAADLKGGTLYQENNRLYLLEVAQVSPEHLDDFCGVEKFKVFNTNNLWVNLKALSERLKMGSLSLNPIFNLKTINGIEVFQLETAMGSAIGEFEGSVGLVTPRSRFLPVKKTNDLFLVQSDLFELQNGVLVRNSMRKQSQLPIIVFDDHFKRVDDYQRRIPDLPSIVDLDFLEVSGDVRFEEKVILKGKISIKANTGKLVVKTRKILDNTHIRG